jgi:hypothetical protein
LYGMFLCFESAKITKLQNPGNLLSPGISCSSNVTTSVADMQWLTILFAMAGKFCVSSSNVVMPVFTAELFPTVMRNLGVGSSNVPAGVALMLVPYLWRLVSTLATRRRKCKRNSSKYRV